jgi:hypothetical protein
MAGVVVAKLKRTIRAVEEVQLESNQDKKDDDAPEDSVAVDMESQL